MTDEQLLEHYSRVGKVLAEMFGPILEVVVHDLRNPDEAIVAIYNGHISGRQVGDPTTDLGVQRIMSEDVPDEIINYENQSSSGERLKSSSLAIRNSEGVLIGSLCLNLDVSFFSRFGKFIEQFIHTQVNPLLGQPEKFSIKAVGSSIQDEVTSILLRNNLQAKVLSTDDKKMVIRELVSGGHFSKKGSVTKVAKELSLTRPSVYKYLKEVTQ